MYKLLIYPVEEIKRTVKHPSLSRTLILGLIEALLLAFGTLIFMSVLPLPISIGALSALFAAASTLVITIVLLLLFSLFFTIVMHILSDGGFYEGLTSIVYGFAAPCAAIFLGSILSYIIPTAGIVIAALLYIFGVTIGFATFFRTAKELFDADYITIWLAMSALVMVVVLTVYAVILIVAAIAPF